MMNTKNSITVLGCEYQITVVQHDQYKTCEGCDGWTDPYSKKNLPHRPDCQPRLPTQTVIRSQLTQ